MIRPLLLSTLLAATACDSVPADPDGTLERIRADRTFRAGLISSGPDRIAAAQEKAFIERVAAATGASPLVTEGAAEPLLHALEEGELDLVVGEFAETSPWSKKVTITEPIAAAGPAILAAAARNGENAWISLLFREAKAASK
jgi:ABC-type amino acid transport substrate-binding protein